MSQSCDRSISRWLAVSLAAVTAAAAAGPAAAQWTRLDRAVKAPPRPAPDRWERHPTTAQVIAATPAKAKAEGKAGVAGMRCAVTPRGVLTACQITQDAPEGYGFGAALVSLAPLYRLADKSKASEGVDVMLGFNAHLMEQTPDWVKRPSARDVIAVYPLKAAKAGVRNATVVLGCEVNERGSLENCSVLSEDPPGYDIGESALTLTSSFLMKPAIMDGKPMRWNIRIPIRFQLPGEDLGGRSTLLTQPAFAAAPSAADMAAAYPKDGGGQGLATLRCEAMADGRVSGCQVVAETPKGKGFGAAAKRLTGSFRLAGTPEALAKAKDAYLDIPFHFSPPWGAPLGYVREARWWRSFDASTVLALFPATAAAKGIKTGVGVADCLVATDGSLTECKVLREDPAGEGFGPAALQVAKVMVMSTWTTGGEPTVGRRVALPIRFNLDPAAAAPAQAAAEPPAAAP